MCPSFNLFTQLSTIFKIPTDTKIKSNSHLGITVPILTEWLTQTLARKYQSTCVNVHLCPTLHESKNVS